MIVIKKYATKQWNEIVIKQKDICILQFADEIKIIRLLKQSENDKWNLENHVWWMYDACAINTSLHFIDLQTGIIYLSRGYYGNLHFKSECIKMQKEYNKQYFDDYTEKLELRHFYNEAMRLYDWYDNEYSGEYDYMKQLYKHQIYKSNYDT